MMYYPLKRCQNAEEFPCVENLLDVSDYPPTLSDLYTAASDPTNNNTCRKGPGDACVKVGENLIILNNVRKCELCNN